MAQRMVIGSQTAVRTNATAPIAAVRSESWESRASGELAQQKAEKTRMTIAWNSNGNPGSRAIF